MHYRDRVKRYVRARTLLRPSHDDVIHVIRSTHGEYELRTDDLQALLHDSLALERHAQIDQSTEDYVLGKGVHEDARDFTYADALLIRDMELTADEHRDFEAQSPEI
jgi:hypothetical protein